MGGRGSLQRMIKHNSLHFCTFPSIVFSNCAFRKKQYITALHLCSSVFPFFFIHTSGKGCTYGNIWIKHVHTQACEHDGTIDTAKNIKHSCYRWCWKSVCMQRVSFDWDKRIQSGKRKKDRMRLSTHAHHKDKRGRGVNALCCSTNLLFIISLFSPFHNCA